MPCKCRVEGERKKGPDVANKDAGGVIYGYTHHKSTASLSKLEVVGKQHPYVQTRCLARVEPNPAQACPVRTQGSHSP